MRFLTRSLIATSTALALASGCAPEESLEASLDTDDEPVVATTSELDFPYESAGQIICDLFDHFPSLNLLGVQIDTRCEFHNYDNLYYLGSFRRQLVQGPNTPQPSRRAIAMSDALFCALKDSDGATADGRVFTGVGSFGMLSRIEVPKKDAAGRNLMGQRVGWLYAFGVGMPIDNQDFAVSFPTEQTPASSLGRSTGYYMDLKSSTTSWGIHGGGQAGLIRLDLDFGQDGNFRSLNNNGFAFTSYGNHGPDPGNALNPVYLYDNVFGACDACRASGGLFCECPSPNDINQHNAFAGSNDDTYRNLGDARLPYLGATGGVSGKYVYREPSLNWTQLGFTSGGTTAGDPDNSGRPSTHLNFTAKLDYAIISVGLTLGVGFRSGMELSQGHYFSNEFRDHWATVKTSLEAQSTASLNARLVIRNPFPFGPENLVDEDFDIFREQTPPKTTEAARVEFDYRDGFPFHDYWSLGSRRGDPQSAHDACVAVPTENRPLTPPASPHDFGRAVENAAKEQIFPCHIRLCSIDSEGANRGHVRTCEWNRTTRQLDCVERWSESCDACEQSSDMCDAAGNVYHPKVTRRLVACQIR